MKKMIISIVAIAIILVVVVFCVNFLATNKRSKNLEDVKNAFIINNANVDSVNSVNVYYGDKTYYVINYTSNKEECISVIDDKEKHYIDYKKSELYKIDEEDYVIGYKYDKLVYEVKEEVKDGFNYIYYDALTGDLIKKVQLDK